MASRDVAPFPSWFGQVRNLHRGCHRLVVRWTEHLERSNVGISSARAFDDVERIESCFVSVPMYGPIKSSSSESGEDVLRGGVVFLRRRARVSCEFQMHVARGHSSAMTGRSRVYNLAA